MIRRWYHPGKAFFLKQVLYIKIEISYLWDNQDEADIEIDDNLGDIFFHSQEDQDFWKSQIKRMLELNLTTLQKVCSSSYGQNIPLNIKKNPQRFQAIKISIHLR
jgi:hypothetical protein